MEHTTHTEFLFKEQHHRVNILNPDVAKISWIFLSVQVDIFVGLLYASASSRKSWDICILFVPLSFASVAC